MASDYPSIRDSALDDLKKYMDSLDPKKRKILAYWVKDYVRFLKQESTFLPNKLIRYKRGSIVKVHLGYRIGTEEGGLHYAIVMDRDNSIYNPALTVIPLTSIKPGIDLTTLPKQKISIGNEVHTLLNANLRAEVNVAKKQLKELKAALTSTTASERTSQEEARIAAQIAELEDQMMYCRKMMDEVGRMKIGSIALVGQITTVSKIRIYDPKYGRDALCKIRVSDTTLDALDARVQELFGTMPCKSK